jgi:hypothetical protein
VSRYFEMGIRWIPKQLRYLTLAVFAVSSVATADCPETMRSNLSGPCIKGGLFFPSGYSFVAGLQLTDLWQLDVGGVHPPLRLTQLKIERLVMESLWGLHPGESIIGDPRWGADKRHPNLDAIAFLRIRETAMTSRYARK